MPQIKFSALVTSMKGKAGGSIFSQNKQGAYFRNNRWGGGRKSARWDAAKNRLQTMSNAWRLLTAEQREAWQAAAVNYPFENKFKEEYIPSGYQLFMSLNGTLFAQGLPTLSVPAEKRPFPEDVQISVATPDIPWVTGGTGATFPITGNTFIQSCTLGRGCPSGYECVGDYCVPLNTIGSPAYNAARQKVRDAYYMFGDPECTSDQDCYDAGLGTGTDIACTDGKCVYVGDGLMYWERTAYVLNISEALFENGDWNQDTDPGDAQINGSFRFTLGQATLNQLRTTQDEIVLVSNYFDDGRGVSIRIRPQDEQSTRVYITLGLETSDVPSGNATFVWIQDFLTSQFYENSVLQFQINPADTVQSFICLNNSGFAYGQFSYYDSLKTGPISEWGEPVDTTHNPYGNWSMIKFSTGFVYGAGHLQAPTSVVYSDIRFFPSRYTESKFALSGMLQGTESILITASGEAKPKCSYKSCTPGENFCGDFWNKCNCAAGICGPWRQTYDRFANQAPGGNTAIRLTAAVPIYGIKDNGDGTYYIYFDGTWFNLMGGAFANNGATFVPLTLATIQGTTESGFQLIVSVSRAKGKGVTTRKTEFIDMTLLPADISAEWELWDYVKAAIKTAPPGTEFWVAFNLLDTQSGLAQCRTKKTIRFKAGADLSSSVN